jgi:DNA-binding transcriptional LysR family regulator
MAGHSICNVNAKILDISFMNNRVDLNLLVVFDAVWRHRRISRAAVELNASQPTVSNALRRLRDFTGDTLFVRSGSGMEPTPFAERLAAHWCDGLSSVRRGLAMRSDFDSATDKRTFTILMSDIAEAVILPHLLNVCRETAPGIFISTMQLPMEQTLPALRTGTVDLAVGYIPELRTGVRQQLLFEADYVALARRGHPGVKQSAMSRPVFLRQRHAVARAEGTGHAIVERTLRKHGLDSRIAVRVPHFLALPMIVGASDLVATVPRPLGVLMADAVPIEILPHPLKLPKLVIRQFWHERFDAEPALIWLRKTLRAAVASASQLRSPR